MNGMPSPSGGEGIFAWHSPCFVAPRCAVVGGVNTTGKGSHVKINKVLVAFSVLSFGTLIGCGGVEGAEPTEAVQSVEQSLCESPPTGICEGGVAYQVPAGLTCNHFGFAFTWTCQEKNRNPSPCVLFHCSGSGTWSTKTISGSCANATTNYCS
jgi:hypothetical protein